MGVTIDDIYDKEFTIKGGGYDRHEVDTFLDEICDEMTSMQEKIDKLEEDLRAARQAAAMAGEGVQPVAPVVEKAEPVAQTSDTLKEILISAQRLSDEAVDNAKRKADQIVHEAQDKADKIVQDAQTEKSLITGELDKLRKEAVEYRKAMLDIVAKHQTMLEQDTAWEQFAAKAGGASKGEKNA